jgi:hypothetical protein
MLNYAEGVKANEEGRMPRQGGSASYGTSYEVPRPY